MYGIETREYVVIGTAFVEAGEVQPSRGRILVFELSRSEGSLSRNPRLLVQSLVKGGVFSLSSIKGRIVAGIDSKVRRFILG
jgi:hypothetical protein